MADNVTLPLTGTGDATAAVRTSETASAKQIQHVRLDLGSGTSESQATGTVPVSGTVTANAGTNLNTSALATEATLAAYTATQRASAANVDGSQVSVTTSAGGVQVLASNSSRKGFILYFAGSCYVSWGGTPTSSSFLVPGGSVLEMLSGLVYTGEIKALSVSGTVTVHRVEF